MMQHLIADLGEHEAHHGGGDESGFVAVVRHLAQMYTLLPRRQLRADALSPQQRIIFTETRTANGGSVSQDRALAAGIMRSPIFFSDLDGSRVVMTMDASPLHSWGTILVPAF